MFAAVAAGSSASDFAYVAFICAMIVQTVCMVADFLLKVERYRDKKEFDDTIIAHLMKIIGKYIDDYDLKMSFGDPRAVSSGGSGPDPSGEPKREEHKAAHTQCPPACVWYNPDRNQAPAGFKEDWTDGPAIHHRSKAMREFLSSEVRARDSDSCVIDAMTSPVIQPQPEPAKQ